MKKLISGRVAAYLCLAKEDCPLKFYLHDINMSCLQAGITVADRLVTVSPGYAEEIRTWLGGWGMEGMIDARGPVLNGIVNGIDDE
jgi:glycogen synthase